MLAGVREPARAGCERAGPVVAAHILQLGLVACLPARRRVDLVAVAERVDQSGLYRLRADEGPLVDQRAHARPQSRAAVGDPLRELLRDRVDHPLLRLFVRRVEAALGQHVPRVLVLMPLGELVFDAELVQRATVEHDFHGDPREAEVARRLQVDLLEGGGKVVGQVAWRELTVAFRPRDRGLARFAEIGDGVAQFLDPGQPDAPAADLRHEGLHPVVGLGPAQRVDHIADDGSCRCVSSADSGSAGCSSVIPSVRSSSRMSGALRRWRSLMIISAKLVSAMGSAYGLGNRETRARPALRSPARVARRSVGQRGQERVLAVEVAAAGESCSGFGRSPIVAAWPALTGMAGSAATWAIGTGAGLVPPGCSATRMTKPGVPMSCCSAVAGGAVTVAPGACSAGRGSAARPPPPRRCVRRRKSARCPATWCGSGVPCVMITGNGRTRRWSASCRGRFRWLR